MQYLECLSAALSDMAFTYQPAESMSTVLRAVMVELRGGPDPSSSTSFNPYKLESSLVPARRGSTIDMDSDRDSSNQWAKKRQMSSSTTSNTPNVRPRPRKTRTMSSGTTHTQSAATLPPTPLSQHNLAIQAPPPPRFEDQSQNDSFIMVTPRSELGTWVPPQPQDLTSQPLSTPPATAASSTSSSQHPRHSWLAPPEFDQQDAIAQLANAHFPELSAFDDVVAAGVVGSGGGGGGGNSGHSGVNGSSATTTTTTVLSTTTTDGPMNLDFMPLGDVSDVWGALGKGWSTGSDLDGFPLQNSF